MVYEKAKEARNGDRGYLGGSKRAVPGFGGFVKRWGVVGMVVCLLVAIFSIEDSLLPELPNDVAESVVEAAEVCGVSAEMGSGCAEAAWAACGAAQRYWEREGHIFYAYNNLPDFDRAKFLPQEFLCRGAHMAELAELAMVLAERYGDAFYEEEAGITEAGEAVFGDFWQFRERMTYTPWFPAEIYTLNDNGPPWLIAPRYNGTHFRVGRWLEKVQDWGDWEKPTRAEAERHTDIVVDWFDPRITEMSESTVALLDLFLKSISERTKPYDSWLPEAKKDPKTGGGGIGVINFFALTKDSYYDFRYTGGDFGVSEAGNRVIEMCLDAAFSARLERLGWSREIDKCSEAGISCIESAYGGDLRCAAVADLAELESQWQRLPWICASADDSSYISDVCLDAALSICHHDKDFFTYLQYVPYRRVEEITYAACSLAEIIRGESLSPWPCSNLIEATISATISSSDLLDYPKSRQDSHIKRLKECQAKYDCFSSDNISFICSELSTAEQGMSKLLAQNSDMGRS